ncbi:ABC transporter, permease protein 1 (cluster 4, leucine/isoleucine/valine/benzoate) (plasmid) [Cupriavidus sp. U2]|uniref:branched-chain amino acid ABC transporter permease n=1 Tax=Cupriavidus sp. U2 TaxID=2920269 RepID=UPI00129E04C0|nr:branched-chain amino acid ABC transporter permease [Cupriavidus sp. U2]KAI3592075.1 ABC transporter, permease protein 1 (cluster 4, leucine/isoleucine/valine/benzoate) [Cupriavidus sp. U2]
MIQTLFNGVVTGLLVALPALALALTFSVLRFANFAIGAMLTAGGYIVYAFNAGLGWPLLPSALAGAVLGGLLAVLVDTVVYRRLRDRSGVTLLVASMGVAFVLENAVRFIAGNAAVGYEVDPARSLRVASLRINHEQLLIAAVSLFALLAIWGLLRLTSLGRAMRAVADNPSLAAARGIVGNRVIGITWFIAGALATAAGTLIGLDATLDPQMGWNYVIQVFAAAILGGIAHPMAAVFGALALGVIAELATLILPPHYRPLIAFAVLTALLLARPWGVFGTARIAK